MVIPRLAIGGRRGWQAGDLFDLLDSFDVQDLVSEVGARNELAQADAFKSANVFCFSASPTALACR